MEGSHKTQAIQIPCQTEHYWYLRVGRMYLMGQVSMPVSVASRLFSLGADYSSWGPATGHARVRLPGDRTRLRLSRDPVLKRAVLSEPSISRCIPDGGHGTSPD